MGTLMKYAIGETLLCKSSIVARPAQLQGRIRVMTRRATLPTNPIIVNSSSRSMIMALSGGGKEGRVKCNHSLLLPYSPTRSYDDLLPFRFIAISGILAGLSRCTILTVQLIMTRIQILLPWCMRESRILTSLSRCSILAIQIVMTWIGVLLSRCRGIRSDIWYSLCKHRSNHGH